MVVSGERKRGRRRHQFFPSSLDLVRLSLSHFSPPTHHPRLPLLVALGLPARHALLEGRELVRGGAVGRHFFFFFLPIKGRGEREVGAARSKEKKERRQSLPSFWPRLSLSLPFRAATDDLSKRQQTLLLC